MSSASVKVVVRFRPLNRREKARGAADLINFTLDGVGGISIASGSVSAASSPANTPTSSAQASPKLAARHGLSSLETRLKKMD